MWNLSKWVHDLIRKIPQDAWTQLEASDMTYLD